jgi:hypothetical protein
MKENFDDSTPDRLRRMDSQQFYSQSNTQIYFSSILQQYNSWLILNNSIFCQWSLSGLEIQKYKGNKI